MKHLLSAFHHDKHEVLKFILIIISCLLFIFVFFEFILISYWHIKEYVYPDRMVIVENKTIRDQSGEITNSFKPGFYETQVKSILSSLALPDQINESTYTTARKSLVELSVPKEYLDFHLSLVIKIDALLAAYNDAATSPSREHDLAVTFHSESLHQYLSSARWLKN